MSDDLNTLQRRLELITAPQLPANVELDQESAELRATWSAFGKLLDAARAGVEPPTRELPTRTLPAPPAGRRGQWPLVAAVALAATVLLAVTVAAHLHARPGSTAARSPADVAVKSPDVAPRPAVASGNRPVKFSLFIKGVAPSSAATSASRPVRVSVRWTSAAAKPKAVASRDTRWQWHDPLDQEMDRVGAAVMQARDNSFASAAGPGLTQPQFTEIRKGIDVASF